MLSNRVPVGERQNHYNFFPIKTRGTASSKAIIGNRCSAWSAAKQDIKMPKYAKIITGLRLWPMTPDMSLCPDSWVIKIGFPSVDRKGTTGNLWLLFSFFVTCVLGISLQREHRGTFIQVYMCKEKNWLGLSAKKQHCFIRTQELPQK